MWLKRIAAIMVIACICSTSITNAQDPEDDHSDHDHEHGVDLTQLPLGDQKESTSPQRDYIWSCGRAQTNLPAPSSGPWINLDAGTWDATIKPSVSGEILWDNYTYSIELVGDQRIITSNGLPDHITGVFPIQQSDPVYQYDRNPGNISEQTIRLTIPANPTLAQQPSCIGGMVGITLSGILIFNGFDAVGYDAVAHEVQDACDGHPQNTGQYHYHSLSSCIEEYTEGEGHSALIGYAFDGFGIYGYRGEEGELLTNAELDECHGHTHTIEWDGQQVEMYHYHATAEFPYTVGCFRGTSLIGPGGPGMGGGGPNGQGGQQGQPPQGGQGPNGQPPQGGQGQNGQLPPPPPDGQQGQGRNPPPPPGE